VSRTLERLYFMTHSLATVYRQICLKKPYQRPRVDQNARSHTQYTPRLHSASQPRAPHAAIPRRVAVAGLTPQPDTPFYGPNPQIRERKSEPPPLMALIENHIFVKPPSALRDNWRVNGGPYSLSPLGSLVDTRKLVCILRSYSLLSQPYRLH
jgi:hypothetical protein